MSSQKEARIILEDGTQIKGLSFGYQNSVAGELVFTTAMTGYPESLTDPSYKGQILLITYPLVGNYGVPAEQEEEGLMKFFESNKIHASGIVISDYSYSYNHWNAIKSLDDWLKEHKIPGIYGVDTRALTKKIREKGSMLAKIIKDDIDPGWYDPNQENLVDQVSIQEKKIYGNGKHKILLVDCGVKYNIIRYLLKRDTTIILVPWDYDISNEEYDGLFISNGPGDPKMCIKTIEGLSQCMQKEKSIFGICLGHQLLSLAAGGDTYKLKFGHRSHNQPVLEVGTKKAYITSQNHGYAVQNEAIGEEWESYFINLNDDTNEGIRHKTKPFFSTQFHPEASGGPTDTAFLFDRFIELIEQWKKR